MSGLCVTGRSQGIGWKENGEPVSDSKSNVERLLDLVFYAPAGLAQSASEEIERLAERGRRHVEGQVHTARLVGQVVVQSARRRADRGLQTALARVLGSQVSGGRTTTTIPDAVEHTDGNGNGRSPAWRTPAMATEATGSEPGTELAIPGYDSLSASQVVQRLGGLSREELEDVKGHEQANRRRRTILNRVDQLLSGANTEKR